ncbi:hypothetical protein DL769_002177 [Monosporascus sp. CRB-8-3]|nr:hypothetical protein DL769_002177 [Monosporascus sp. CRB-8-3]
MSDDVAALIMTVNRHEYQATRGGKKKEEGEEEDTSVKLFAAPGSPCRRYPVPRRLEADIKKVYVANNNGSIGCASEIPRHAPTGDSYTGSRMTAKACQNCCFRKGLTRCRGSHAALGTAAQALPSPWGRRLGRSNSSSPTTELVYFERGDMRVGVCTPACARPRVLVRSPPRLQSTGRTPAIPSAA